MSSPELVEKARILFQESDAPRNVAWSESILGRIELTAGRFEQAEMWLGQSFQYTPDNVILGQTQCGPAEWKETSLSSDDFLREYHVSFERLGIVANRVARFDVSCHGEHVPGQSILVAGKDKAFTLWDGVFFKMEKAGPDPQQFAG